MSNEHEDERMRVWTSEYEFQRRDCNPCSARGLADAALAEFDKRFPAPTAAPEPAPVTESGDLCACPVCGKQPVLTGHIDKYYRCSTGGCVLGPTRKTKPEARAAWNSMARPARRGKPKRVKYQVWYEDEEISAQPYPEGGYNTRAEAEARIDEGIKKFETHRDLYEIREVPVA